MAFTTSGMTNTVQSFNTPPSEVESGSGGGTINKVKGMIAHSNINSTEQGLGNSVTGTMLNQKGSPMTGEAIMYTNNSVVSSKSVNGRFKVVAGPSNGVESGDNVTQSRTLDFVFSPAISGINYTKSDVSNANIGTIQYGSVEGKVTDYNGNPVRGTGVFGSGAATASGKNGDYILVAPGGTSVTLLSLGQNYTFSASVSGGSTTTENLQYSMLSVEVLNHNYNGMENVPVKINGDTQYTDSAGKVSIPEAEPKKYNIAVQNEYKVAGYEIKNQGTLHELQLAPGIPLGSGSNQSNSPGGSVVVQVVDAETEAPISGVDMDITNESTATLSGSNGEGVLLSSSPGSQVEVNVSVADNRYESQSFKVTVPNNGEAERSLKLQRAVSISTY